MWGKDDEVREYIKDLFANVDTLEIDVLETKSNN